MEICRLWSYTASLRCNLPRLRQILQNKSVLMQLLMQQSLQLQTFQYHHPRMLWAKAT